MLHYACFARDHCADPTFYVSVVDAISRAQREIRAVGCFVVELDYGGEEVRKRRRRDSGYASSKYHSERRGRRDADCDFSPKRLQTQGIDASSNGGSG